MRHLRPGSTAIWALFIVVTLASCGSGTEESPAGSASSSFDAKCEKQIRDHGTDARAFMKARGDSDPFVDQLYDLGAVRVWYAAIHEESYPEGYIVELPSDPGARKALVALFVEEAEGIGYFIAADDIGERYIGFGGNL